MNRDWLIALAVGAQALARTYHGGALHFFWYVYSGIALFLYFAGRLADLLEKKA